MSQPQLICGGLSFEDAPVEIRERVAFTPIMMPPALEALREGLPLEEAVLLSTCNRVEYFGTTRQPERAATLWPEFLRHFHRLEAQFEVRSFALHGQDCTEHLFSVAAGLKSMVIGETEILGQVKEAYGIAQREGSTGKWTNRLFQSSFAAAKEVRTLTQITRGSVSVGSVAVDLAEKIFGGLGGCGVVVIGAGETSERVARSLRSRGAKSIIVANRTFDRAEALANELGGRAVHWQDWEGESSSADIMISSTAASHYVLTRERMEQLQHRRQGRPLFLIDLAVPRDLEPSINLLDDVYLYDIDDLQSIAAHNLRERQAEVSRGMEVLKPHLSRFRTWAEKQAEVQRLARLEVNPGDPA